MCKLRCPVTEGSFLALSDVSLPWDYHSSPWAHPLPRKVFKFLLFGQARSNYFACQFISAYPIPNKKNTYYSLRNNLSRRRFEVDGSVYLIFEIFRGTFRNFLGNVFQWRYEAVRISILPCSLKYRAAAICEPITTATRRWCTRTFSYTAAQGTRSGRERVTPWNIGYIDFNHYCRV